MCFSNRSFPKWHRIYTHLIDGCYIDKNGHGKKNDSNNNKKNTYIIIICHYCHDLITVLMLFFMMPALIYNNSYKYVQSAWS